MNIGAGLSAANAFFKQNEHIQDRDYLAKQRAYQQQVMDTEAAGLSDASAAKTAANRLAAARANAGMETLPQETQNRMAGLGLESGDIAFRKAQQPAMQENARKATTVQGAGLDSGISQIPFNEQKRVATNAFEKDQIHKQHLLTLAQRIFSGDTQGALNYMNEAAAGKRKFVDLKPVIVDGVQAVQAIDDQGSHEIIPRKALETVLSQQKTGKYKFLKNDNGQVIAGDELTGNAKEVIPPDPKLSALGVNGKPSEMQMQFTFLTQHQDGPKLTKEKATEMITKGSHKTAEERYHAYKTELVKAAASWNKPIEMDKINEQAAALAGYDPNKTPGLQSGSNTPSQFKVNPSYERLVK